jgi:hypothetical protein
MLTRLMRTGLRRGIVDGHRGWLWTGVGAGSLIAVKKLAAKKEETVYVGELKPGTSIQISAIAPVSKRDKKRAKKSAKAQRQAARAARAAR